MNFGKRIIAVLCTVFSLALLGMLLIASKNDNDTAVGAVSMETTRAESENLEKWQEGIVSYNGKIYQYNSAIKTYLFLGIDQQGVVTEAKNGISGGQSDAMFLLVDNGKEGTLSVVSINRNTMTDVDVYDEEGKYVSREELQICLQHGYGDGLFTSCARTADAVSRLFYQLPIYGYLSLNMDGIPILNDAVGGVTVEVLDDLENQSLGVSLKKGEQVTLNGQEAYTYIRLRDINEFDSATKRLMRQQQYLLQLFSNIKSLMGQSSLSVTGLYEDLDDYVVTNIDFMELAEKVSSSEFDESRIYTVPGETFMKDQYEAYYVDDTALYEMILDIFYEQVN